MKRLHGFWLTLAVLIGLSGPPAKSAFAQEKQAPAEVTISIDPRPVIFTLATVPVRATLCGLNSWLASIFMTFSAGMRYGDAAHMTEQGCAGSWIITPEMIDQAGPPPAAQKRAVWEIDNLR